MLAALVLLKRETSGESQQGEPRSLALIVAPPARIYFFFFVSSFL